MKKMVDGSLPDGTLIRACEGTFDYLEKQDDRIEKLAAALREIATGYETEWSTSTMDNMLDVAQILSERINIARKALEGKDD
jgi:hypothetical protein